jgi:hypothetical protein
LFYGFQIELDQIHQRLSNQRKRAIGSCAVVLWGPPGCGKTHLAREYLWRHRDDFQSGIFWIDCRSEESIYKSFWEIAQAAALLGAADVSGRGRDWNGATTFVEAVRKWFESKEGWLIVFDSVTFDSEDEILTFMKFIPDSKGNSIIFTSVDRTLAKRQRLLYPAAVKVSPLSVDDARRLLYKGLDIKNPTPVQEAKATELVKYYECLPLAIHAAGHVLTAKGKALEKFHVRSYPTSKRLAEPYAEIMQDLRENFHHEAINLINLLGFFGHSVPVAMLQLGRRALRGFNVEIRSIDREGSTRRDLETTIATLIKYGMVERTLRCYNIERTDSLNSQPSLITTGGDSSPELMQGSVREDAIAKRPESSLESSSTRSTTYSIDILQVHTVIQGFCRDELRLKDKEMYWWWLIIAVELFRLSYFSADERIRAPGGQGLVRDYREYETHAARLYSHFPKDKHAASVNVQKARHELRKVIRAIKREIENRSPSQTFRSARQEVQISIFEHTSSTSSDGPDTPMSTPSRSSTWALEGLQSKSESPIQIENGYRDIISGAAGSGEVSSEEDHGYLSGFDDSMMSSIVTERRRSIPELQMASSAEGLERLHNGPSSRRSSFLQAIFKGHPAKPKHKDLGDWRPVPAPPSLIYADVRTTASSRASSIDDHRPISAGSQAEAALAAVHRFSPPASRGGQIKSPNQPATAEPKTPKQPLGMKSPNLSLSPLALEFNPNQPHYSGKSTPSTRYHSRSLTTSPPLLQIPPVRNTNLNTQSLTTLPIEENTSYTHRIPSFNMPRALPLSRNFNMTQSDVLPMPPPYLPTGYASQPMSRDGSRESSHSLATAPAGPGATSLSPPSTYSYLRRTPPTSTDALATSYSNNHLNRIGDWAATSTSPTGSTPLAPVISLDGAGPGVVQFGSASPVNIYEARTRADEHARRLMLFETGTFRANHPRAPVSAGVQRASSNNNEAGMQGLGLEFNMR